MSAQRASTVVPITSLVLTDCGVVPSKDAHNEAPSIFVDKAYAEVTFKPGTHEAMKPPAIIT